MSESRRTARRRILTWVAVAQEAHDQGGVQAQAGLGVDAGAVQAVNHDRKRQSVALHRVRLGVEEDLGAPHTPSRSLAAVRHAEVVEIILRPEHIAARVVQVQEALEVVEVAQGALRLAPGLGVAIVARKLAFQSVAQRDRQHCFRLESPLDVDVELGLGETPHEAGQLARVAIDRSRLGGAQPAALDAAKVDDVSHLLGALPPRGGGERSKKQEDAQESYDTSCNGKWCRSYAAEEACPAGEQEGDRWGKGR